MPKHRKTVYLNTGDPTDRYFTNISWAPDAKKPLSYRIEPRPESCQTMPIQHRDRELMATLFEETHPKYVEPQHPIVFSAMG